MFFDDKELSGVYLVDKEIAGVFFGDKEIYSGKVQLKYVITFTVDTTGTMPTNIKKYSVKDGSLLLNMTGGIYSGVNGYNDGLIRLNWGNLKQYRWTFTPLVSGSTSVSGLYNRGHDYGGNTNQIVPYTAGGNDVCVITFVTTDKHKP